MDAAQLERDRLQDFTRNGPRVTPTFSAAEMQRRLDALRGVMSQMGVDAALFSSYHNINYYSDFLYCYFGRRYGLVVTPDGTRRGHTHWKSGFYRIARETGMPVTLGYVDRTTMTSGLGPTMDLTGDIPADMDRIRAFYADKAGLRPEHRVEPRLREEG